MSPAYMQRAASRIGMSLADYQANRAAGLKWCFKHRQWHPREHFGASRDNPDGLRNECRAAINVRARAAMKRLYWRRKGVTV